MTALGCCCETMSLTFRGCKFRPILTYGLSEISLSAMPIPNDDLEGIFQTFYPHCARTNILRPADAHKLAVLFMVFLLGALYDLEKDCKSSSIEAEDYHLLARAALASDPVTENTTVHAVQAFVSPFVLFCFVCATRFN
jgi:hypothetical protein